MTLMACSHIGSVAHVFGKGYMCMRCRKPVSPRRVHGDIAGIPLHHSDIEITIHEDPAPKDRRPMATFPTDDNPPVTPPPMPEQDASASKPEEKKSKATYLGMPAASKLHMACRHIMEAYRHLDKQEDRHIGMYLVGSALDKPNWRDVDVVLMMDEASFYEEFPDAHPMSFEWDSKWLLLTVAISDWLSKETGLPVDFKFQPSTWANNRHRGPRHALGRRHSPPTKEERDKIIAQQKVEEKADMEKRYAERMAKKENG